MVYTDLERMTNSVLELFLENGHQRISYIGGYQVDMDEFGGKTITENEKRSRTYLHFMRDHHLENHITHYLSEWTEESGEQLASELLADNKKALVRHLFNT